MGSPFNPFKSGATANAGNPNLGGGPPFSPPPSSAGDPLTVVSPPTALLAVAAGVAAIGVVLAAVGWGGPIAVIGWALAGPVAIGVMALYLATDTKRRAEPVYLRPEWLTMAYAAVAVLAVAGIVASALSVAFWVGRL
ncbi:hypothetical protein ACGFK1_04705 [Mycobacterium sp. NPDC048908]|uniref:hypothetical protein n=1 Tax=Mycobacterium sp. NPDC048908 TaxID=3364292 RepID=UPI00371B2831